MNLRDYQRDAIDQIRDRFRLGQRKALLYLSTGSGKTTIFSYIVKQASDKGNHTLVLVRGRGLVEQASRRLFREKVEHGTLMAGSWNYRPQLPNQVASVDTIISRGLRPKADLIIVDEAHMACSKGYKEVLTFYPKAYVVAVTATPFVSGSLRHIADSVVHPITMQELTDQGYLSPFRYFAPNVPDLSGVKVSSSTKDYVVNQLETAMNAGQLTGKIIEHWKQLASNRPTICFAVNVHHSKTLVERFKNAGVAAEHCDADSSDSEREDAIRRLESGTTQVICNVGIFCTGIDIPCVSAIIMARPTTSRNLFVQQAGRGTRVFEGKENCLLLDHAGNIGRHGLPTDEGEVDLEGRRTRDSVPRDSKTCKHCFAVFRAPVCPECGIEPQIVLTEIEETDDKLVELNLDPIAVQLLALKREAKRKGRKESWAYYRLVERYNKQAYPYLPPWFLNYYDPFRNSSYEAIRDQARITRSS